MAVSGVGAGSTFSHQKFRAALTDAFAGTICSILSIAYCLSYAALIFTGPLEHELSYGVAVTFLSAAIGGSIVALRSSLPFAIAGPDSSVSVVMAAMVATLVQRLASHGSTELLLPTLVAMSLTTALTGLLLCILGVTHAGRAIRFVPFPVIGGFLGATGWLMIMGAMQVVTDQRPALANLDAFINGSIAAKLAAGAIVAVALHLALRRSKSPFILPAVLLRGVRRDVSHFVIDRFFGRRGADPGLDVPAATRGRTYLAVAASRTSQLFLDGPSPARRRFACRHVRHRHQLVA